MSRRSLVQIPVVELESNFTCKVNFRKCKKRDTWSQINTKINRRGSISFKTIMTCIFPKIVPPLFVLYLSLIGFNGYRYAHYQHFVNWTTARDMCQTINFGNLTSIDNQAQQDYLFSNFKGFSASVWIGLNDIKVCISIF